MRTRRAEALRELPGRVVPAAAPDAAARRGGVRVCARGRRFRGRRRPARSPESACGLLDGWEQRLHAAVDRRVPGSAAVAPASRPIRRTCSWRSAIHSVAVAARHALRRSAERIQAGRHRDAVSHVGSHDGLLPTLGQPGWTARAAHCRVRRSASRCRSDAMCTALQLTNFWQDLKIDFDRGRIYLPDDERERHGALERDLADGNITPDGSARCRRPSRARGCSSTRAVRLRRRQRTPSLRVACDVAWRHAHPRSAGTLALRRRAPASVARRGRRYPDCAARARVAADGRADMSRDTSFYYSFLVLPPQEAARDHRGLGFLPRGGRCGG